jgi:hypothetical protein
MLRDQVLCRKLVLIRLQIPERGNLMKISKILMIGAALLLVPAIGTTPVYAKTAKVTKTAKKPVTDEGQKLRALFAADDEANLKRNPISALFRGDMRYADQLGEFVSDGYYDRERAAANDNLAKLAKLNRAKLNATDKIAYDIFTLNQKDTIKGLSPE